jgi:hypothetical protein|tara:strand:- start:34 stop:327 length:294 start_codon:yes stop_codon:yes gene_type:complete
MADLQSMTLQERMNSINGDGLHEYTFQEACNKYLSDEMAYAVNYNKYTPDEAFAIIRAKSDLHSKDLTELLNEMGSYDAHEYTATEALNKEDSITEG